MQWTDIKFSPTQRELRQFAGLLVLFGLAFACWGFYRGWHDGFWIAASLGAILGAFGVCFPRTLKWVYIIWMVVVFPIGWTVSKVILLLIFVLVFLPFAVVFRLIGRDALSLRKTTKTLWNQETTPTDKSRYFHQF